MSAYEFQKLKLHVDELTAKVNRIEQSIKHIEGRLALLEIERIPMIEENVEARYKQATEGMHHSLLAMSKASLDGIRADIMREVCTMVHGLLVRHESVMHPSYAGTASGSANIGSS
jgi:hypothetical protein